MAYREFPDGLAGALSPRAVVAGGSSRHEAHAFSALERSVILLARDDLPSSLRRPGRWQNWSRLLFGAAPSRRLADPRLEALRRMAVLAWHGGTRTLPEHKDQFIAAGYSEAHYVALGMHIAELRGAAAHR